MRRYADGMVLFLLALALRAACLADLQGTLVFSSPLVDAYTYDQAARAVAVSGPEALETPFYQPPLYPLALGGLYAITGGSYLAPRVVQAVLGALTAVLVAALAARAAGRRAGWIAGLLFAAYGPVLYFESELLPVALILALQTGALALVAFADPARLSRRRFAGAGLLLGVAAAARPTGFLLAGFVAAWRVLGLANRRRAAGDLATFAVAVLVPVLPFTAANLVGGGEPVLVSWNGGLNFYLGNGANADSLTAIQPGHHWDKLQVAPFRDGVRASRRAESDYWTRRALREMAADPVAWGAALSRKAIRLLQARETPRNTDFEDFRRESRVLAVPLPGFALAAPLACLGLLLTGRDARLAALRALLACALAAAAVQNLAFFVADRYRLEAVPALCVLAALGAEAAIRRRGRIGAAPYAVAAAVFVFGQLDPLGERGIDEARAAIHRAVAMQHRGLEEGTRRMLETALRHDPRDVDAHRLLGEHFVRRGDAAGALLHFDQALSGAPDYVDVLLAKARLLEGLGRGAESEPLYRRALEADPYSVRVRLLYGVHLAVARRPDEARAQFEAGLRIQPGNPDLVENLRTLERSVGREGS